MDATAIEARLRVAIQAALDVGSHIVPDDRRGEPETGRDVFRPLDFAAAVRGRP